MCVFHYLFPILSLFSQSDVHEIETGSDPASSMMTRLGQRAMTVGELADVLVKLRFEQELLHFPAGKIIMYLLF